METKVVLSLFILLSVILLGQQGTAAYYTSGTNPGFRVIVTQRGLDYVSEVAGPLLEKEILKRSIPPYTKVFLGIFNFTAYNAVIHNINFGNLSLSSTTGGLSVIDNGISLVGSADWSFETESSLNSTHNPTLFNVSYEKEELKVYYGTLDASGSGISLKLTVDVTMNKTTGGVHLDCTFCHIDIDKLILAIHGASLIDKFHDVLQSALKELIKTEGCSFLKDEIKTKANNKLSELINVTYNFQLFGKSVQIDYGLVSNPDFSHPGLIIIDGKGEFRLTDSTQEPPFPPPPLPETSLKNLSKMFYIQLSTYVAESASWAFWKAGVMQYNLSNDQIPAGFDTTGFYCDIVAPELCRKYPNKKVMFGMAAVDYPRVNITPKYAVMTGRTHVNMYVENNGREEVAFTLQLDVKADIELMLDNSYTAGGPIMVCGNVSNPQINVTLASSNIGQFNCSTLKNIITTLAPKIGLAFINNELNRGIPIPTVDGVSFIDPTILFGNGYAEVNGNVKGSPK